MFGFVYLCYLAMVQLAFVDDFRKITRKNTDGLIARWKYFWMSVVALVAIIWLYWFGSDTDATRLVIPFFKGYYAAIGSILYCVVLLCNCGDRQCGKLNRRF